MLETQLVTEVINLSPAACSEYLGESVFQPRMNVTSGVVQSPRQSGSVSLWRLFEKFLKVMVLQNPR